MLLMPIGLGSYSTERIPIEYATHFLQIGIMRNAWLKTIGIHVKLHRVSEQMKSWLWL